MSTATTSRADWRTPTVVLVGERPRPHAVDGDPSWLRPVPAADERRSPLGSRDVRARDGGAEPDVGRRATVRGHARRSFRQPSRSLFVGALLYIARPRDHGASATTPLMLVLTAGVLIGTGLSGLYVPRGRGRARPQVPARKAQHGARHLRRGGIVRPVRDAPAHAGAPVAVRLVQRTARARGGRTPDGSAHGR